MASSGKICEILIGIRLSELVYGEYPTLRSLRAAAIVDVVHSNFINPYRIQSLSSYIDPVVRRIYSRPRHKLELKDFSHYQIQRIECEKTLASW